MTSGIWSVGIVAAGSLAAGIAPEATRILKASTDFLASQQQFRADTRNTLEIVLKSGQKIEFNSTARQSVQRPNKLRAERTGDLVEQVFVYDGRSLALYNPQDKVYAQVAAPATLEAMLDFARTRLDIVAPVSDLIYKNAYDILNENGEDLRPLPFAQRRKRLERFVGAVYFVDQ